MPHGNCFLWRPSVLWLHVISDLVIAAAYYSIPILLYYVVRKRSDFRMRGLGYMFAGFIFACGTSHLMLVWDIWHSTYRLEGVIKAITAALSIATAIVSIRLAPTVLKIGTPEQLNEIKAQMREEICAREYAEEQLRRHIQAELTASEDKLRSCFEAASQAILGVSAGGQIVLVNRRTEEMFGYSRDELLGEELELLLPDRFRTIHHEHRDHYFKEPRVRSMGAGMELAGRRKDGTEFPIEIGLSHVQTPDGPLAFGLVSDISERRKAADELKRVNDELRRSNVEIEQFAHVASHDLQEPLRMITNYLQLVERRYASNLDEDGKEFIHYAVDGAKRMKALIADLLDFSRVGTSVTNYRSTLAASILQDALTNLKTAIDESGAQITADPLPPVVVDPILLTQVFQNLIANAIKFHKGTTPRVHISAKRQSDEWIFSVRDNGIGIELRHIERIFRIFERLHAAEDYPGSGIGLAVTKKIVERHGGRIWAESTPGLGSTFYFSIAVEKMFAARAGNGTAS